MTGQGAARWQNALDALALFAIDPHRLGGLHIRVQPGPARDAFGDVLTRLLPSTKLVKLPASVPETRLGGGLDLAATLATGKPVFDQGVLASADGGVIIASMAERLERRIAARLEASLDTGHVKVERDHLSQEHDARFGLILFDESEPGEGAPPVSLCDRLAFSLSLDGLSWRDCVGDETEPNQIEKACLLLPQVVLQTQHTEMLVQLADALGIASLRAPLLAAALCRVLAARDGREETSDDDVSVAAQMVLAPRATRLPAPPQDEQQAPPPPEQDQTEPQSSPEQKTDGPLDDLILDAVAAAIPSDLLAKLKAGQGGRAPGRGAEAGRKAPATRGRPLPSGRGDPRRERLDLLETLRAAIPWQGLRQNHGLGALAIRKDDLRVKRFRPHTRTTTIFVVDASGSSALHRLAEAKGAVELVLAECYVRRDEAALIAFRGTKADVILPPTRSLTRARARLKGLPGGGGTPLALGLDAACTMAEAVKRKGDRPYLILLTDAQANVARDGTGGRARAESEALAAADQLRARGFASLIIDTSPRPQPKASQLAQRMGADYLALPQADARTLAAAITPHR